MLLAVGLPLWARVSHDAWMARANSLCACARVCVRVCERVSERVCACVWVSECERE